ncbi:MAG: DegT/DnrJ/EryC1/StrS family aminotransferase [Candidatus Omnitrophica bacterium]|nr:DegT/DnrJ/EryC1/StrS family aminotransferase [Candidatus Omnitrophota bacterium]MCM8807006.1 DegT/DnrJ/EryC1/StrS family aminotransferase [Candidatus Omnitrophota bacterium]
MAKLAINGGKPVRKKPFPGWPIFGKEEEREILKVLRSGKWWMYAYSPIEFASGKVKGLSYVEKFERKFAEVQKVKHCIAVNSGSSALEICVRALGIGPGDEVITTPYTFIATVMCVLNHYALPVFVDIDPETYQIDANKIEEAITERTKAIIPVHFSGNMPDMDKIMEISKKYNLKVIEDAAHAHYVFYKDGRSAGGIGDMGIFSFQQSKNLTAGEGGAITTNDDKLAELSWSLRHYGREKNGLWYEHVRLGWNLRMSEFQGALLLTQLKRLKKQTEIRMKNYNYLVELLKDLPGIKPIKLNPKQKTFSHHLAILRYFPEEWDNIPLEKILKAMEAEGIPLSSGYLYPLYHNPLFKNLDFSSDSPFMKGRKNPIDYEKFKETCKNVEEVCKGRTIWIVHRLLLGTKKDMEDIAEGFYKLRKNIDELK